MQTVIYLQLFPYLSPLTLLKLKFFAFDAFILIDHKCLFFYSKYVFCLSPVHLIKNNIYHIQDYVNLPQTHQT
jgi:hypothetical protein